MHVRPRARGLFGPVRPLLVRRGILGLLVASLASIAGCSPSPGTSAAPVEVRLRDFHITSPYAVAAGSDVVFRVHNAAPVTHEFVVVPTDLPSDALPLAADGLSVDEEAFEAAGEISDVPARTTATLELHLPAGRYVLFCNLDGHYLGGMHASLQVTAPETP
jgi:uncharacterized cupredoxin-like copper-binding protein